MTPPPYPPPPPPVLPVLDHTQLTLFSMNDRAGQQDLATTQIPIFHFSSSLAFNTLSKSSRLVCARCWFPDPQDVPLT